MLFFHPINLEFSASHMLMFLWIKISELFGIYFWPGMHCWHMRCIAAAPLQSVAYQPSPLPYDAGTVRGGSLRRASFAWKAKSKKGQYLSSLGQFLVLYNYGESKRPRETICQASLF